MAKKKKKRHFKRDCQNKKGMQNNSKSSKPHGCVANTSNDEEVLYSKEVTIFRDKIKLIEVWLMDSKSTRHMTPNQDWFYTYELISRGSMFMNNDHALKIVGIGTIKQKYMIAQFILFQKYDL